ncbi:hypothetical protein [Flavobacterium sp.]
MQKKRITIFIIQNLRNVIEDNFRTKYSVNDLNARIKAGIFLGSN